MPVRFPSAIVLGRFNLLTFNSFATPLEIKSVKLFSTESLIRILFNSASCSHHYYCTYLQDNEIRARNPIGLPALDPSSGDTA
jgi:hypothetical protein